jgi:transcriptional regulator with GAF, ATPase, and Fis domain
MLISSVHEQREWPEEYVPRLRLLGEMLVNTLERARALEDLQHLREKLEHENIYLRKEVKERLGEHIVGRSAAIRATRALADQVVPPIPPFLGETGTGKERFGTYIHECSRRRDRPMIRVNCSAIPVSLIESELFGREKVPIPEPCESRSGASNLPTARRSFSMRLENSPAIYR